MRALYSFVLRLALPFVLARLAWRGIKSRGYWAHIPERLGFNGLQSRDSACFGFTQFQLAKRKPPCQ